MSDDELLKQTLAQQGFAEGAALRFHPGHAAFQSQGAPNQSALLSSDYRQWQRGPNDTFGRRE